MSLVNNNIENLVDVDYSTFDLSHFHKTTMDMGDLVPIAVIPTLPGDNIEIDVDAFVRAMPTIAPIMDKIDLKINHFFVPYRILWDKWENFITQSDEWKTDSERIKPSLPSLEVTAVAEETDKDGFPKNPTAGNWRDYITGKPVGNELEKKVITRNNRLLKLLNYIGYNSTYGNFGKQSLMPILAYNKIFQDYYVPQRFIQYLQKNNIEHNLIKQKKQLKRVKSLSALNVSLKFKNQELSTGSLWRLFDSFDEIDLFDLKKVYWNQDYITSALPEPTLFGDVKLPLFSESVANADRYFQLNEANAISFLDTPNNRNNNLLSNVRDLRKAVSLQHYMEVLTQSGGRYIEALETQWDETINPELLQMSQYIGGSVIPIFTNEVEATAATEQKPLGALAGKPLGAGGTEKQQFHAQEYGVYMCLAHIVPKRSYTNATAKFLKELDVLDFPNPAFEGMGDEAVYNYELGLNGTPFHIYGYTPRYSHYKMMLDRYSGDFQSSLKHWHLGEDWSSFPNSGKGYITNNVIGNFLPENFEVTPESIEANPRTDIFQVPEEDGKFFGTFNFRIQAGRKLHYNAPMGLTRL